ncbi:reverse transcriptase domain-containing protein [Tanacetum coccineum]
MESEGRLALKEKVFHWLKEGLIRKVQYPEWIANTITIKLASGTWKVQVDYSSLNKVCAKDMYPLLEEGEGLASLMGYPYKCFLRLLNEYNQIRMAEGDEEKIRFHTKEGVLADQRGRKTYLEEIVIKSKSELGLVQDVKETLRTLKRVNIKINLTMSSFGVKEGRFLGHMTNEAEEALRRIKRKLSKLQTLAIPKEGEDLMLCLRQRNKTISSVLLVEREGIQIPVSYEAEGPVVKKFFGQGEQVEETPDANNGGIFDLSKGFQANSTPTTRAWRLYLGRETIEEGSGVGIILISPKEKMYSYAIWLKFKASNHAMDCEALLAGLAASANQGMKDLHVFIDSLTLVTQIEGNHTPATEQERRYKEEIIDAMVPFHRFRITHLPNSKILKNLLRYNSESRSVGSIPLC